MQVEEAYEMVPATTLYFTEKYDLGATYLNDTFHKVSLLQAVKFLIRSEALVLEVPEPLWVRFLPKNLVLLAVWKLMGQLQRRPRMAVTYAIENNDLTNLLAPKLTLPEPILRLGGLLMGVILRATIDRIAYGSAGSMAVYHSLPGVRGIPHRLIEELPAAVADASTPTRQRAIFIGELDDRKGILDVMEAWPGVESAMPEAVLTVIGAGPHSEIVSTWCRERAASRHFAGFLSHEEVKQSLQHADVLVAPSRRSGRWREQIGLPIAEAVSHGLTVVTTDETGLATWLAATGHTVIEEGRVGHDLRSSLIHALNNQLPRTSVINALPPVPGRIEADKWLHAP
ncbi:glycosyltransferase [Arthrobacter sp. Z1-9]